MKKAIKQFRRASSKWIDAHPVVFGTAAVLAMWFATLWTTTDAPSHLPALNFQTRLTALAAVMGLVVGSPATLLGAIAAFGQLKMSKRK